MIEEQGLKARQYLDKASKIVDIENMQKLIDEAAKEFIFEAVNGRDEKFIAIYNEGIDEKLVQGGKKLIANYKRAQKQKKRFEQFIIYLVLYYKELEKSYFLISRYNTPTFQRLQDKTPYESNFSPLGWFICRINLPNDVLIEIFDFDNYILFWDYYGDFVDGLMKKFGKGFKTHEYFDMLESLRSGDYKFNFGGPEYELFAFYEQLLPKIKELKDKEGYKYFDPRELYPWIASTHTFGEDKKNVTPDNIIDSQYQLLERREKKRKKEKEERKKGTVKRKKKKDKEIKVTVHGIIESKLKNDHDFELEIDNAIKLYEKHSSLEKMRAEIEQVAYDELSLPNDPEANKAIDKFIVSDGMSWLKLYDDPDEREIIFLKYKRVFKQILLNMRKFVSLAIFNQFFLTLSQQYYK